MGSITCLPGVALPIDAPLSLNLSAAEVQQASGGYVRPAEQLRELHARGYVRAWRSHGGNGKVILSRAHYDAIENGKFGPAPAANEPGESRAPLAPNRAGYRQKFGSGKGR